jgi:hypothetical protein
MDNPILNPDTNPAVDPPEPQILDVPDPQIPTDPIPMIAYGDSTLALAYGGGDVSTPGSVFRLERGVPRYRYGRLTPVLPQFRAQKLYTGNVNTVPTNVPLTQASPATSPFVNATTGRVGYPVGPKVNINAPDLP